MEGNTSPLQVTAPAIRLVLVHGAGQPRAACSEPSRSLEQLMLDALTVVKACQAAIDGGILLDALTEGLGRSGVGDPVRRDGADSRPGGSPDTARRQLPLRPPPSGRPRR